VNITNVNDDPTALGLPATVMVSEDVAGQFDLSSVVLADVDSAGDLRFVLTAGEGRFTATSANGVAPDVSGSGKIVTLTGTVAELNSYLSNAAHINYTSGLHDNGTPGDTVSVTLADADGSGAIVLPTIVVNITPVNDVPTATDIPTDLTATEDVASAVDLSAISLSDVEGDVLTVTLSASVGTLAAINDGGVTVAGSGSNTLILIGAVSAIDGFLNTANQVTYTGAENANGDNAATLTITANDGAGDTPLGVVNLDLTAVNDAPAAADVPASLTAIEDTVSNIDLTAVRLSDIEQTAALTMTLTVDEGRLSVNAPTGVFSVVTGGGKILTLSGPVAAMNAALAAADLVQYLAPSNVFGSAVDSLAIKLNDNAGSGDVVIPSVTINVTAANDIPTVSGVPTRIDAVEDITLGLDLSDVLIADIDAGPVTTLVVSTVSGTLTAAAGTGVTADIAADGKSVSLTGSLSDLNSYLDQVGRVSFTGAANANGVGADTIALMIDDGAGGQTTRSIAVDIESVVDVTTLFVPPGSGPVTGGDETDLIFTGSSNDSVDGGKGDDIVVDTGGDDIARGGAGNDGILFLKGTNEGYGGEGSDVLVGGIDGDFLSGGLGNDILLGDVSARIGGRDQLNGGKGDDLLSGSVGVDSFEFKPNDGNDVIAQLNIDFENPANSSVGGADFVSGIDQIVLEGFGYLDPDAALAHVADVGGIATFADQGTTITFFGVTTDDLSADDFFIL
jgi:hypothetical protein